MDKMRSFWTTTINEDAYKFLPILFIGMLSILLALLNISDSISILGIAVFVIFTILSLIHMRIEKLLEKEYPESYRKDVEHKFSRLREKADIKDRESQER